jgi:enoyl-CoA hydratase/carnithine racemase
MTEHIRSEHRDHILTLTFARPDKKNALTNAMYGALADAIIAAEGDPKTRVIVLRGEGDMYTAGNDVGEFAMMATGQFRGERHVSRFIDAIARATKPMVAAVQGRAVGIGTTMLLHCDYVVAAESATFATPFTRLGLLPEAASSLLGPRRMGHARAFALLVMGRPLDAAAAKDAGLVNEVVEAPAVEDAAMAAAREIAALPAGAVAQSRALLRGELDDVVKRIDTEAMAFRERLQSDEARAAFTAFLSRRK